MFTTLEEQAPNLFVIDGDKESNRGDIIRFVKRWNKFKELILVSRYEEKKRSIIILKKYFLQGSKCEPSRNR